MNYGLVEKFAAYLENFIVPSDIEWQI